MTSVETLSLRDVERRSIAAFLEDHAEYLKGRVLDYGCGKKPYQSLVTDLGCEYTGYDRVGFPGNVSGRDEGVEEALTQKWDTVMSTQVIQYVHSPLAWLEGIRQFTKTAGHLVLTGPTNWPIVESSDRWRFTPTGIATLLNEAGFFVVTVEERASVEHNGEDWLLGWGAVAQA